MNNTKIDKSAVCTAFACAVAAFVCGFVFCLALLSGSGSCYFLVKDFLFSTRGYFWLRELIAYIGYPAAETVQIFVLLLVLSFAVIMLLRLIFVGRKQPPVLTEEPSVTPAPVLPPAPSAEIFADEIKVASVLEDCRRHPDADGWRRLNALEPEVLARYLKNEYPQVTSLVLLRLEPKLSAAVLSLFPSDYAAETMSLMLNSRPIDAGLAGTVGRAVAENIENAKENDSTLAVGRILSCMVPEKQEKIISDLEKHDAAAAADFRTDNIVFEDLILLLPAEFGKVLEQVGEPKLVIALRGASEKLRNHIYSSLPPKQAKLLRETLAQVGPIKLRDIEKAQQEFVFVGRNMYADALRSRKNG